VSSLRTACDRILDRTCAATGTDFTLLLTKGPNTSSLLRPSCTTCVESKLRHSRGSLRSSPPQLSAVHAPKSRRTRRLRHWPYIRLSCSSGVPVEQPCSYLVLCLSHLLVSLSNPSPSLSSYIGQTKGCLIHHDSRNVGLDSRDQTHSSESLHM
jgi:hypothetical protein